MSEPETSLTTAEDRTAGAAVIERGEKLNQARRRLFPHALFVGIATGALAIAFRVGLGQGEQLRAKLLGVMAPWNGTGLALLFVLASLLIGTALWLVLFCCPE